MHRPTLCRLSEEFNPMVRQNPPTTTEKMMSSRARAIWTLACLLQTYYCKKPSQKGEGMTHSPTTPDRFQPDWLKSFDQRFIKTHLDPYFRPTMIGAENQSPDLALRVFKIRKGCPSETSGQCPVELA